MFGTFLRCFLIGCGIYGNFDFALSKNDAYVLNQMPGGKIRFFEYLCNYFAIFALTIGFVKKLRGFRNIHSFLMTVALSTQFTAVTLYWSYKKMYPAYFKGFNTGDIRIDIFIEMSQHFLLFLACLLDPFLIGACKKFISFILFIFSFGYVAYICYLFTTFSTWPYLFFKEVDDVSKAIYLGLIIILPQFFL